MFLILQKNNAELLDSRELQIKTPFQKSANSDVWAEISFAEWNLQTFLHSKHKEAVFPHWHVIKLWNSVPQDVAEAKNINEFKKRLDKFTGDRSTSGN